MVTLQYGDSTVESTVTHYEGYINAIAIAVLLIYIVSLKETSEKLPLFLIFLDKSNREKATPKITGL